MNKAKFYLYFILLYLVCHKKYCTSRCLVLLLLEIIPFSASSIVLLLSWYIVIVGTGTPCAAKEWLIYNTWAIESSMGTNSASIELFVLIFCLHDAEYATPFPSVIITTLHVRVYCVGTVDPPVCLVTRFNCQVKFLGTSYVLHDPCELLGQLYSGT